MLFGVLVVYSESYLTKSVYEFQNILNLTGRKHQLIIVLNNPQLEKKLINIESKNVDFFQGSNKFHEFGGWSEGLAFIKKKYPDDYKNSEYIFCNDTFCHHRTFKFIHGLIFSITCSVAFLTKKPTAVGELHSSDMYFEFNNATFNTWVSSYFFAFNKSAIQLMQYEVLPSDEMIKKYLQGGMNEELFFTDKMDSYLKNYLLDWLFGGGWYKSAKLQQSNMEFFFNKARSIVSEFYLSSNMHKNNVKLINTYRAILLFNKVRRKFGLLSD